MSFDNTVSGSKVLNEQSALGSTYGTLSGSAAVANGGGVYGAGIQFSGEGILQLNYLGSTTQGIPVSSSYGYTLSIWVKQLQSGAGQHRTLFRETALDHLLILDYNSDNMGFYRGGFIPCGYSVAGWDASAWYHLVVVGTASGTSRYYVNGAYVCSVNVRGVIDLQAVGNYQGVAAVCQLY